MWLCGETSIRADSGSGHFHKQFPDEDLREVFACTRSRFLTGADVSAMLAVVPRFAREVYSVVFQERGAATYRVDLGSRLGWLWKMDTRSNPKRAAINSSNHWRIPDTRTRVGDSRCMEVMGTGSPSQFTSWNSPRFGFTFTTRPKQVIRSRMATPMWTTRRPFTRIPGRSWSMVPNRSNFRSRSSAMFWSSSR